MSIYDVFILLGGVGLFLYGMTIMSTGLKNACGENLRVLLENSTKNKFTSVLVGILVTIFIQSSSATDVMVIGFVTSSLMTLTQAIGVIMGANIGTTITAQITAFNIGAYAPFILFIGAIISLFVKHKTIRHVGSVILGFGMLFEGITLMKSAIAPLSETPAFINLVSNLEHPIITVLFGIIFTAILQSSSSATVIFQAFAVQGIISYRIAVYLIIGAAIGAVTPNLLAGLTANRAGRRCSVLNLLFNTLRALLILVLITLVPQILTWIQALSPGDVARQIANTHTIFAIVAVLALLPFSEKIVKLSEVLIPVTPEETKAQEEQRLIYLTQTDRIPAALAIRQAHLEITRLGHIAMDNLYLAIDCFFSLDDEKKEQVKATELTVDYLTHAIVEKLVELRSLDLSGRQMSQLYGMIQAVDDLERISDHAENIVEYEEMLKEGRAKISEIGLAELKKLSEVTTKSLHTCLSIFEKETFDRLPEARALEQLVDDTRDANIEGHVKRLMKDRCDPQGGIIFTDMSSDLERCSDHAINVATAMHVHPVTLHA
ncbi:MAG: Na/Pi cotransporter family protein [Lachnospiraceae bacterium]|nr:Na/Pi cotransporter family protein [Lachnospiraceae bacterium]